ncbi:cobyrinate a,c-diamide synthase [Alteribacillus iranensis]|uniref:Cobyrinate a,c-diamide synthase n=1 Tax=Alteribacillus iranensis TaxID=930128 RepID=A0A1I2B5B1_9BACI|nr:cobyrinate a,c-diamide synthase [Alteribacillus iranensis]SFE51361.1 cobyrinic acid a,c-diamide synthase [Alteribacillus iranensis]
MRSRITIAGTGSGTGKTTVSIGLMAAFKKRGLAVQGFKCGPDYIDPSYHTAVTNRTSRNLDSWMLEESTLFDVFQRGSEDADISIIEGVMGMYDGKSPESDVGSTAEISNILASPIILVVHIGAMARSAAAIVKGFQLLSPKVEIGGVIVNQAGSEGHYQLCKKAIEKECGIPVVGYLLKGAVPSIPERHLGLIPAIERGELDSFFEKLGETVAETVDLELIQEIARQAVVLPKPNIYDPSAEKQATIAVAQDAAFNFYYPENLELLEENGAELIYFSPLAGEPLPEESHALYIGGGFPEEFAVELAAQFKVKHSIRKAAQEGMPMYAECGGYMFFMEELVKTDGSSHDMLGLIPAVATMKDRRAALGYREVTAYKDTVILRKGESAKGHEFHYSTADLTGEVEAAYDVKALRKSGPSGYSEGNITASYIHLHFGSNPQVAQRLVHQAWQWKKSMEAVR